MDNIIPPVAKATIIKTPEHTNVKRKRDDKLLTNPSVSIITNLLEVIKNNHQLMITKDKDYNNSSRILRDLTEILGTQIVALFREEAMAYRGETFERMAYCGEKFERREMIRHHIELSKEHIESLNNNKFTQIYTYIYNNLHQIFRAQFYELTKPKYVRIGNNMQRVFPTNYSNITKIAESEIKNKQEDMNEENEHAIKEKMKQEYTFDDFVDDMFDTYKEK
jgi:hypothetical protein